MWWNSVPATDARTTGVALFSLRSTLRASEDEVTMGTSGTLISLWSADVLSLTATKGQPAS